MIRYPIESIDTAPQGFVPGLLQIQDPKTKTLLCQRFKDVFKYENLKRRIYFLRKLYWKGTKGATEQSLRNNGIDTEATMEIKGKRAIKWFHYNNEVEMDANSNIVYYLSNDKTPGNEESSSIVCKIYNIFKI